MSDVSEIVKLLKEAKLIAAGNTFPAMLQYLIDVALHEAEDELERLPAEEKKTVSSVPLIKRELRGLRCDEEED